MSWAKIHPFLRNEALDDELIQELNTLDLHNAIASEQLNALLSFRNYLLNTASREYALQSHPKIPRENCLPFVFLENGDFILNLGSRKKVGDKIEIEGSSKKVFEVIVIHENKKVEHGIELVPSIHEISTMTFENAQNYLLYEFYNLRMFRGHPNIVQSLFLYQKYINENETAIVHIEHAYEGGLVALFYNTLPLVLQDKGLQFIKQFISVFFGYLRGLVAVHEKGVHGDVSPSNIFFKKTSTGFFQGVVSDFEGFALGKKTEARFLCNQEILQPPDADGFFTLEDDIFMLGTSIMLIRDRFIFQVVQRMTHDEKKVEEIAQQMRDKIFNLIGVNELIEAMRDSKRENRPTAQQVFKHFQDLMGKFNIPYDLDFLSS